MERSRFILLIGVLFLLNIKESFQDFWLSTDDLENQISPEDLQQLQLSDTNNNTITQLLSNSVDPEESPNDADCFGLNPFWTMIKRVFCNMKPASSSSVNTRFYFFSRNNRTRVQVLKQKFRLESVDFKPNRKTVLIVHGFMSHSNASWVNDMAKAFLTWADVNVIAVDWSGGGETWKYWRAVANTRTAGADIAEFMKLLMKKTGAKTKDMHFVGHSLGAHIVAFASLKLGKVARITGLDPARPCFKTNDLTLRLDKTDAGYVDIIHTNCRSLTKWGFGFPDPIGHADFYPNGGMKQPGCYNVKKLDGVYSNWLKVMPARLKRSMCGHKRAYMYFTESLINKNCSFRGHKWDLTYEGVNTSLLAACKGKNLCPEMGINANGLPRANGTYFVLTTDKEPFCPTESERRHPEAHLLSDLKKGKRLDKLINKKTESHTTSKAQYADSLKMNSLVPNAFTTTTAKSWYKKFVG